MKGAPLRLAALSAHASQALVKNATGGSAVPLVPATYGRQGYRVPNNSRPTVRVKSTDVRERSIQAGLFRRQDRDRYRILFGSADLQDERAC